MWWLHVFDAGAPLALFPWTISILLQNNRDMKHTSVIFGLLVSSLLVGRVFGGHFLFEKVDQPANQPTGRIQCALLSIAFFILAGSTGPIAIAFCYFIIGFASSSLGALIVGHKTYLRRMYRRSSTQTTIKQEVIRTSMLALIFFCLGSGILYDNSPDSLLPAFTPCLIISFYFLVVFLLGLFFLSPDSIFQKRTGRIMESVDGSKAGNSNPSVIPIRDDPDLPEIDEATVQPSELYMKALNGDLKSARKAYAKRLTWRRKYDVENIFSKYQSNFDDILKYYPHAIHGRSKEGCAIVYELIGQGNPKELLGLGITPDSLLWHFNLRNEYIFRQLGVNSSGPVVDLDEKDRVTHLMTIIDVKGISVSDFTTDVISFMQKSSDVIESYYPPGTVVRLVIVNAPYWFSSVWGMIAKVLPESVNKKVITIRNFSDLDQYVDPSQRPVTYGGTDPNPIGSSPDMTGFIKS